MSSPPDSSGAIPLPKPPPTYADAETQATSTSGPAAPYDKYPHLIKSAKPFFPSSFKPFFSKNNKQPKEEQEELHIKSNVPKHYVDEAVKDIVAEWKNSVE
jgi:hypothetical protein